MIKYLTRLILYSFAVLLAGCTSLLVADLALRGADLVVGVDENESDGKATITTIIVKSSLDDCNEKYNEGDPTANAIYYCELALTKGQRADFQVANMYESGSGGANLDKPKALEIYKRCAREYRSHERDFVACTTKVKRLEAALVEPPLTSSASIIDAEFPRDAEEKDAGQKKVNKLPRNFEENIISTGSGFFVAKSTVVTNKHVVERCSEVKIRYLNKDFIAKVKAISSSSDLALIQTDLTVKNVPSIRSEASLGEEIMVAGFPLAGLLGTDLIVTSGQVNSLAGLGNDAGILQISAPVQPGNSGGPLIDRSGRVVGVVVSKLNVEKISELLGDSPQNINFAVKPELLVMFLSANHVVFNLSSSLRRYDGVALARQAKVYTAQILCF
jgi:S1-C subfamily serine protease